MSTPPTMNGSNQQQTQPPTGHPNNGSNQANQSNLLGFNSMNGNQLDGCNNVNLIEPPDSSTTNGLANGHNNLLPNAGSNVGANCTSKWQAALANTNNLLNNNLINNNLLSNNLINNFNNFLPSQLHHHHPVNHHLVNHQLANHHSMYSIDSKPQIF